MRDRSTKYFVSMESSSGTESYRDYILSTSKFLNNLQQSVRRKTILRMPQNTNIKYNFCENLTKNFQFKNDKTFSKACDSSKLIVHTYNSTPFLETLSVKIPSILILDKNNNPFKIESKNLISALVKNRLLFFNMRDAAKFVNKLWSSDINYWWQDNKTQKAVNEFTKNYAKKTDNYPKEIKKLILSLDKNNKY